MADIIIAICYFALWAMTVIAGGVLMWLSQPGKIERDK